MTSADSAYTSDSPASKPLHAVLWMFATGLCFVAVIIVIKSMQGRIPPFESAFIRYLLGTVFLIPFAGKLWREGAGRKLQVLLSIRGVVHALGVGGWFFAMSQISLAEVTAIGYLTPIFITLGAALFLGERLALRRMAAICIAFIGALIILRPGVRAIEPGHLTMLGTAFAFGVSHLMAKYAVRSASPSMIVAMLTVWVAIALCPFALMNWVTPSTTDVALLFLVACFATLGHYTMMLSFAAAPVAVSQPVTFLQLVWATLIGVLFFEEAIDPWVIAGAMLILACITYISWREAVLKQRGRL